MSVNRKRLSAILGGFVVAAGTALVATTYDSHHGVIAPVAAAQVAPLTEVDVATVAYESISEWQQYSGRLEAIDKVEVRPLVPGTIMAVHFKDGALVKKGDLLFNIDPRPYQAAVDRASAEVAAAEAGASYAQSDAARADRLLASNAIAKRDFDEKHNAAREAAANLKAARAALQAARVNLAYTDITAPVDGRVSRAELTVGNVVSTGATAPLLTTLVSVSPIYAAFNVDEQTYLRYLRQREDATIPVGLGLADEQGYSHTGTVASVDNQLDAGSGTIRVRARFDNADGTLVPGLYARVRVGGGKAAPAILIDDAAVGTDQAKKYVLVLDAESRVQYREVTLGNLHNGRRLVLSGLQPGERIVVNGLQRVRPSEHVQANVVEMAGKQPAATPKA